MVHHAGAGTAAAGLRAGAPAVPVPVTVTADQPFGARRLAVLGAATAPLPFRSLTAELLTGALDRVVRDPAYTRSAQAAAKRLATEDGAGAVLKAVERQAG